MRIPARLFTAAALGVAALGTAAPASAACVGTAATFVFCATANPKGLPSADLGGQPIEDCVYLGVGPCQPVSVPTPRLTPGSGNVLYLGCGGQMGQNIFSCESPI
jgi:hypothetical protein